MDHSTIWASPLKHQDPIDEATLAQGQRLAEATACWLAANMDDFVLLYSIVKDFQRERIRGRIRDRVIAEAIRRGSPRFEAEGFKFANALWAGITRYMCVLDNSLLDNPITLHKSAIDAYGLPAIRWPEDIKRRAA